MIKLGSHVRDMYTGFEGTATGRTEWLYGCARIAIEPRTLDKDGKVREVEWVDEQRVQVVEETEAKDSGESNAPLGGPHDTPKRHADPTR